MTAQRLLDELETLPSHARIRRMVELGRAAAHDPDVAVTLAALEQGDFYERFLALHSCFGSYDGAHVLRALTDPSRIIRGVAIHLSVLACDEEQLVYNWSRLSYKEMCHGRAWSERAGTSCVDQATRRRAGDLAAIDHA